MKKIHLAGAVIGPLALLGILLFGAIWFYAEQNTIPSGTTLAGLQLGGIQTGEAMKILDRELSLLRRQGVVFTVRGTEKALTWQQAGVTFDAAAFREETRKLSEGSLWKRALARKDFTKTWSLEKSLYSDKLRGVFTPEWEKSRFGNPVNAVRIITPDDQIRYMPGQEVDRIDWELLMSRLSAAAPDLLPGAVNGGIQPSDPVKITVPLRTVQPSVTIESLRREGINRKIVQFSSNLLASGNGRVHNIGAAARSVDGIVLAPGAVFDYEEAVDYAEKTYGFQNAPVIFGGKLVPGIGGGICQVSSTLYNAAIRAGLTIVERRNHSLPVSYVPKGQDATFAKGYINFRFKNNTGHHLLIRARIENKKLTVKLFGDTPENVSYTIQSRTTKVLPAPNKYVVNASLLRGSKQVILQGKPGYMVETYQIKKVDGKTKETALLSSDTYPPQPTVIAVREAGPGASQGKTPNNILEDGVKGPDFR